MVPNTESHWTHRHVCVSLIEVDHNNDLRQNTQIAIHHTWLIFNAFEPDRLRIQCSADNVLVYDPCNAEGVVDQYNTTVNATVLTTPPTPTLY